MASNLWTPNKWLSKPKSLVFNVNLNCTTLRYVGNDESKGEISKVLGSSAAAIEEAKADVMGVWNMLYKVRVTLVFMSDLVWMSDIFVVFTPFSIQLKNPRLNPLIILTSTLQFNNGDLPADLRNKVLFTYITSLLRWVQKKDV